MQVKLWKRNLATFVMTVIIYVVLTTIAGAFSEFLTHLRHITLNIIPTIISHAEHGTYLIWPITKPSLFTWLALALTVSFLGYDIWKTYTIFKNTRRQYEVRDRYAAYGTSRWQTRDETKAFYEKDNNGYLLGDYEKITYTPLPEEAFEKPSVAHYAVHPWTSDLNQQYIVFGPPGSDKTTGFILPNIFHAAQQGKSIIATDPKGELYELTAEYMRQRGYNVIVLDYLNFRYGHRLNLLHYIYDEAQIAELASMYLESTRNEGDKRDFWEGKAQELFTSLIGFVKQAYGKKGTLTDVYRLIPYVTNPEYLLVLYEKNHVGGAAKDLLKSITAMAKSENTLGNIAGTLSEKLQLFTLSNVRAQTSTTDFDISSIADTKTIVYVWMSDSQNTYAPLVTAFWTVLFNALYERARKNGNVLPIDVLPLMDELGNVGKIAGFITKLTTMRSRHIYPMMIWHSIPQIKLVYGDKYAEAMLGACDTKILLGCGDLETAEYMSKMIGDTTIETQSKRGSRTLNTDPASTTNQYAQRRLMQAAEIMRISKDDVLVWQRKRHPVILKKLKYRYWENLITPKSDPETTLPQYQLEETQAIWTHGKLTTITEGSTPNDPDTVLIHDAELLLDENNESIQTDEPIPVQTSTQESNESVPVHTGVQDVEKFWEDEG